MKTYCQCKSPEYIGAQLDYLPRAFNGNFVQVHPPCRLPFRLYWETFIRVCPDCLREVSLPWKDLCYGCWKLEYPNQPYMGWLKASKPISLEKQVKGRILNATPRKYTGLLKEFPGTPQGEGRPSPFTFGEPPGHPEPSLLASQTSSEARVLFDFSK